MELLDRRARTRRRVLRHLRQPQFQPVTVPVQVISNPGDFASPATTIIEPSPLFAELKPPRTADGAQADAAEEAQNRHGAEPGPSAAPTR